MQRAIIFALALLFFQTAKVVGPVKVAGPAVISPAAGGGTPSFIQEVVGRCANATDVNCVTVTATFTIASTGANHYATAQFWDNVGSGITPSSGTNCNSGWVFPANMQLNSGPIGDISGGYCVTLASGVTSVAFTFSANIAADFAGRITERSCSSGTPTYGGSNYSGSTNGGSSVTSFGTQVLSGLTGNNSIDQMLALSGTPGSPAIGAPYNTNLKSTDSSGGGGLGAILVSRIENVTADTSATWSWTGAEFPFSQAIAMHC